MFLGLLSGNHALFRSLQRPSDKRPRVGSNASYAYTSESHRAQVVANKVNRHRAADIVLHSRVWSRELPGSNAGAGDASRTGAVGGQEHSADLRPEDQTDRKSGV